MAYNTGNPIGSTDPRDLSDNSENFDRFANGTAPAYEDRFGVSRKSFAGMEQDFADFLANSGYEFLGDYAAGIEVTAYNQIIRETGEFWRAAAGTTLPYTTTGTGMPEGGAFVSVGDANLRQQLASTAPGEGASLVSMEGGPTVEEAVNQRTIYVGSVAELVALPVSVGQKVSTLGYYSAGDGGHNDYEIVAGGAGAADGGRFIDLNNGLQAKGLFTGKVYAEQFGAVSGSNSSSSIQAALNFSPVVYAKGGSFWIDSTLNFNTSDAVEDRQAPILIGEGPEKTFLVARTTGPQVDHTTTQAQGDAFSFSFAFALKDLSIIGDGSTPAGAVGVNLNGTWMPWLENVYIQNLTGNAVQSLEDGRFSGASRYDKYSLGFAVMRQCRFIDNDGWGIRFENSAAQFHLDNCQIQSNLAGGVHGRSLKSEIIGGSVSYNGQAGGSSRGIQIAANTGLTPQNWVVRNVEVDRNYNRQVDAVGYNHTFEKVRMIDAVAGGSFRCTHQYYFGDGGTTSTFNIVVKEPYFRFDNATSETTVGVFGSTVDNLSVVNKHQIGTSSGLTLYDFTATSRSYAEEKGQIVSSSPGTDNQKRPTVLARIGGTTDIAISDGVETDIPFSSEVSDSHDAYDAGTYEFTAPYTGIVSAKGNVTLGAYATGKFARIRLRDVTNSTDIVWHYETLVSNGASAQSIAFDLSGTCIAGRSYKLIISTEAGTGANIRNTNTTYNQVVWEVK
jgi:hypothetical protein